MDGEEGEVDDLGLDAPKAKAPRRSCFQAIRPTIVEVDYEGTKLKLLGELGTRRVWMELTSRNMKFLFDQVSADVGLEASAASQAKARGTGRCGVWRHRPRPKRRTRTQPRYVHLSREARGSHGSALATLGLSATRMQKGGFAQNVSEQVRISAMSAGLTVEKAKQ